MKIKEKFFVAYLTVLTVMLTNWMLGKFTIEHPVVFRTCFILLFFIGVSFLFYLLIKHEFSLNPFILLILIFNIYIFFVSYINGVSLINSIKAMFWGGSIIIGYYFSINTDNKMFKKNIKYFSFLFIILLSFYINNVFKNGIVRPMSNLIEGSYILYFSIILYSYCCIEKDFKFESILTIIVLVCSFISYKRATILLIVMAIPLYYYFKVKTLKNKGFIIKRKHIIVGVSLIFILLFTINFIGNNNIVNRFSTSFSSGGSGRLRIWENTYNYFKASSIVTKIFGHGFETVLALTPFPGLSPHSAHNDFIEVLFDYGIVGLITYLYIVIYIIYNTYKLRDKEFIFLPVLLYIFPIWFFMSFFSDLILWPMHSLTFMFFAGFLIAKIDQRKQELLIK